MNRTARSKAPRVRSNKAKQQRPPSCPMTAGYAMAEALALAAVKEWAVNASGSDSRITDIEIVRATIAKAAGRPDALTALQDKVDQHITERPTRITMSDACVTVLVAGSDAGYLYGLALGLALAKGGAR